MQVSNGLFVIRDEIVKARSWAEDLDKKLSEAMSRELKALNDLRAAQNEHHQWREMAEKEARILNAKLSDVMARLAPVEEKLSDTLLRAEHAEDRADSAEAAARDAAEKLARAEKDAQEALDKLAAAEAQAQERMVAIEASREREAALEIQLQGAIESYKNSPDFFRECDEAVVDAYVQGFERCKERLSQLFKLGNLEHFRALEAEVEQKGEEPVTEEAADEVIVASDPAVEPATVEDLTTEATAGEENPEGPQEDDGPCP